MPLGPRKQSPPTAVARHRHRLPLRTDRDEGADEARFVQMSGEG